MRWPRPTLNHQLRTSPRCGSLSSAPAPAFTLRDSNMKTKRKRTTPTTLPGGTFKLADDLILTRVGYGAMQLAGPHVFGPPADHDGAIAVLRQVVSLGITHIDTSDYYGPHITNQLIKEALHPYPEVRGGRPEGEQLRIVTKVGALRDAEGNWPKALSPGQLR